MGHIREYCERLVRLDESEWSFIASHFKRTVLDKGQIVTRAGETEEFLSFIESGAIRYYVPGEDRDLTFDFSLDREFSCAYDSFLTRQPSQYAVETLSRTVLWQISYSDLQAVYNQTRVGSHLGRFIAENLFLRKSQRERSLRTLTAKERYLRLFKDQPEVVRRIPLKYIASYIGVTPQALSRIRRQIC